MRIFLRLWMLLCLSGTAWAVDDALVLEEGPLICLLYTSPSPRDGW